MIVEHNILVQMKTVPTQTDFSEEVVFLEEAFDPNTDPDGGISPCVNLPTTS